MAWRSLHWPQAGLDSTMTVLPAVHYGGPCPLASVDIVPDGPHKLDQGLGGLWDPMVWPYCVVKVADEPVCVQLFFLPGWRTGIKMGC